MKPVEYYQMRLGNSIRMQDSRCSSDNANKCRTQSRGNLRRAMDRQNFTNVLSRTRCTDMGGRERTQGKKTGFLRAIGAAIILILSGRMEPIRSVEPRWGKGFDVKKILFLVPYLGPTSSGTDTRIREIITIEVMTSTPRFPKMRQGKFNSCASP